jgi:hypothetical protein
MSQWRILRSKSDVVDDVDVAVVQDFSAIFPDPTLKVAVDAIGVHRARLVVIFFDGSGQVVLTGRGSFTLQFLEIVFQRDKVGKVIPNTVIVLDGVELTGGEGFRVVIVDDLPDAQLFSVRLTDIVAPPGATNMKVYFREIVG